ncbi:uncharacterized protein N0V89_008177 [Didymosphaeria variabile]|uniref:Uncharacterized protein n=1 Tax=Didymosphaeria variabile TaxID=1932322 RepID=A0A9W8XHL6_9PLEO|nr:uncharacterized protein N0V89_008177 [Didymosphaeria variabile]KAJ4349561.1 hypothetical protein N0V89_008177 [Didymosphaeria variabile]
MSSSIPSLPTSSLTSIIESFGATSTKSPWGKETVTSVISEWVSSYIAPTPAATPPPILIKVVWDHLFPSLAPSVTAFANASVPLEFHNITETRIKASIVDTAMSKSLFMRFWYQLWYDIATLFHNRGELFWASFVLSAVIVLYVAYIATKSRLFSAYFKHRYDDALARHMYPRLWDTSHHWVLSSLISLWLRDRIPGDGPWKRNNAASLRAKADKSALQGLVRMGIYPLFIQDGGFGTVEEKKGGLGPWGGWSWGLYKQSKRRAVFEFVVPRARGWMLDEEEVTDPAEQERRRVDEKYFDFVSLLCNGTRLRRAGRWRVAVSGQTWSLPQKVGDPKRLVQRNFTSKFGPDHSVPSEAGAMSRFKALLPFKADQILREEVEIKAGWENVENWVERCRLLTSIHVPVVRIEAPDSEKIELDKEVLLIAREANLDREWDEAVAVFELRKAYREVDQDPFDFNLND